MLNQNSLQLHVLLTYRYIIIAATFHVWWLSRDIWLKSSAVYSTLRSANNYRQILIKTKCNNRRYQRTVAASKEKSRSITMANCCRQVVTSSYTGHWWNYWRVSIQLIAGLSGWLSNKIV